MHISSFNSSVVLTSFLIVFDWWNKEDVGEIFEDIILELEEVIKVFEEWVKTEVKDTVEKFNDVGLVKEFDSDLIDEDNKWFENNVDIEVEGEIFGEEEI